MTQRIPLVQGDTAPQIKVTLTDDATGEPVDLTDASVKMYFREAGTVEILDTLPGVILDAPAGVVVIDWKLDTLNVPEGVYEGEIEVTFQSGDVQTVFQPLAFAVRAQFA
jgi:hypothetical protein